MKKAIPVRDQVWQREEIESPCVNICVVHPRAHVCAGCLRTLDEIATWSQLDAEDRSRIMAELPNRRGHLKKRRGGRNGRLNSSEG